MDFEWDEAKYRTNLEKHHVAFEDAIEVFSDPNERTERSSFAGEDRFQTIGLVRGTLFFVVYTMRSTSLGGTSVRIISARIASRRERMRYDR